MTVGAMYLMSLDPPESTGLPPVKADLGSSDRRRALLLTKRCLEVAPQFPAFDARGAAAQLMTLLDRTCAPATERLEAYRRAAALDHGEAMQRLGDAYRLGDGVERDLAQARGWYLRAAKARATDRAMRGAS
jgi:TPR repeat protein